MLTGLKDKGQGRLNLKPGSPDSAIGKKGMTIVELMVVLTVFLVLLGGVIAALNTGQFSNAVSSAKVDLQAQVRSQLDMITRDMRQGIAWDISANTPSVNHIKFRPVYTWDSVNNTLELDDPVKTNDYIEYTYDSDADTITRTWEDDDGNDRSLVMYNIIASPFYIRNASGTLVALNSGDLLANNRLTITIAGQSQVRGSLNLSVTLSEEVKVRNE